MTSVWLMNMPADRAAVVQRKMANKPTNFENSYSDDDSAETELPQEGNE